MKAKGEHKGFPTPLLDGILQAKKQRREEERMVVLRHAQEAIGRLANMIAFHEAFVFGSLAKPDRFCEDSDVDIALAGIGDEEWLVAMAFLSRDLGRDVDVIQLNGHRLEQKVRQEGLRWKKQD